jgi:hypothetical protein
MSAVELVCIIFVFAYYCGIFWYLGCELILDFYDDLPLGALSREMKNEQRENFITVPLPYTTDKDPFGLIDVDAVTACITVVYFLMTSLTTVGLGDYHPVQNIEYVAGAMMLLFGVLIFSNFMNIFMDLIFRYKVHVSDFDEGEMLVKFIGTLKRFNNNEDINSSTRHWLETYFDYRWNNYKNKAFKEPEDIAIFDELPVEIRI